MEDIDILLLYTMPVMLNAVHSYSNHSGAVGINLAGEAMPCSDI
ncbi:MAG: hypothetical protein QXS81_01900 [Candidatus Micrarchaeaceae archaeon]